MFLEIALSSSCLESKRIPLGIMNNVSNSRGEMSRRVQERLGLTDGEQEENCSYRVILKQLIRHCYAMITF